MTDKELFNAVLDRFCEEYGLKIERPYGDGYFVVKKGKAEIGGMNQDGYNLLCNLSKLCRILEFELR